MKTFEDERYIVTKAYKFTILENLRFFWITIYCMSYIQSLLTLGLSDVAQIMTHKVCIKTTTIPEIRHYQFLSSSKVFSYHM